IVDQIDEFAKHLKPAAVWHGSGLLIADVETENPCEASGDFVYEMYCLWRVVADIAKRHFVRLITGSIRGLNFPRKPAKKRGWPRFDVFDEKGETVIMQVCAGTGIYSANIDAFRYPDISFQHPGTADAPTELDLMCMYDAKFNEGHKKTDLSEGEYAKVQMMVSDLGLNRGLPLNLPVSFTELQEFDANCVLTNGGPWKQSHTRHQHHSLRVVYHFSKQHGQYGVIGI
ncbi:MAG: hypothetical protein RLZZ519_946, partial [Bacteroidota bacterium]